MACRRSLFSLLSLVLILAILTGAGPGLARSGGPSDDPVLADLVALEAQFYAEQKIILPTDSPMFGADVAISGDTAVVGARAEWIDGKSQAGAAYIYVRSGGVWTLQQKIVAADVSVEAYFGAAVAISGDTVAIGAPHAPTALDSDQGAVYVFTRSGMTWTQQAKLTAGDLLVEFYFGQAVALDGDTLLVGVPLYSPNYNYRQGAVFVYTRSEGTWTRQAVLVASDGLPQDCFGESVALSGDTALIGVPDDAVDSYTYRGSAYVFVRDGGVWSEQAQLIASDGTWADQFGLAVALSGDTALVGVPWDDIGSGDNQGSAYVFVRSGTTWSQQAMLLASDGAAGDDFGRALALYGDEALIGAYTDDVGANQEQGSAYLFRRSGSEWTEHAHLAASDGAENNVFGLGAALSSDTAMLGATQLVGESGWTGAVYAYRAVPAVISIARTDPSPTAAASVGFRVTFSEDVTSVDAADFALAVTGISGAAVSGVSGAGVVYTVTAGTGSGSGTLRLDVPDTATIVSGAGEALYGLPYADGESYTVDKTPPAVLSITRTDPSPTAAASVGFRVTFSEDVSGVDAADFALTATGISGAAVSGVSGAGAAYTVTVGTGAGDGTLRLDIPGTATIADAVGNALSGLPYTGGESYTVDKTPPAVQSITRLDANPTNAANVRFAVAFSEVVVGVEAADFALAVTGISGAAVSGVSGAGAVYTVTASTGAGDGTLRLDIPGTATIADAVGNGLGGLPYTGGESYTVDKTPPAVQSITRLDASPTNAASVRFAVVFSETVVGVDAADFALTATGISGAAVSGVSGAGAVYTVTASTGAGSGTLRLDIPGTATIADAVGNALSGGYTGGETYTVSKGFRVFIPLVMRLTP